jgi:cellulose biosynthesis protein BcsQ
MIIAFVQTKGGTGKSTLTLAIAFARRIRRAFGKIAMVELDPQGTLRKWWQRRVENRLDSDNVGFAHVSGIDRDTVLVALEDLEKKHDLLILDVPGESISKFHTQFACAVADLVMIPMRTSTNDEEAFEDNLLPIIEKILAVEPESREVFHVIPAFIHPLAGRETVMSYFAGFLPPFVYCLESMFYAGSVFENFSRGGTHLYEYAELVKTNRKLSYQADKAIRDIEAMADAILQRRSIIWDYRQKDN